MNSPQCPICVGHWMDEGRPVGNYLIVSRGGHIPGVHRDTPEAAAAAAGVAPEPAATPAQCIICRAYWKLEGRPRDYYLILSKGDHIPGVHDDPAAVEQPPPPPAAAPQSRAACITCAEYWIREGRPRDHYLILSTGQPIPDVDHGSSPHQTSPEAAGTSQVPDSISELRDEMNRLKSRVNQLDIKLSRIQTSLEAAGTSQVPEPISELRE